MQTDRIYAESLGQRVLKAKEQLSRFLGTHKEFYPQDVLALNIIEPVHCQVGSTAPKRAETGQQCAEHTNCIPGSYRSTALRRSYTMKLFASLGCTGPSIELVTNLVVFYTCKNMQQSKYINLYKIKMQNAKTTKTGFSSESKCKLVMLSYPTESTNWVGRCSVNVLPNTSVQKRASKSLKHLHTELTPKVRQYW